MGAGLRRAVSLLDIQRRKARLLVNVDDPRGATKYHPIKGFNYIHMLYVTLAQDNALLVLNVKKKTSWEHLELAFIGL
jgi:hypothetical protein